MEQQSIPIYDEDWGADEELLLIQGAESYGLGSWADIADHIGGYRERDEVRDHYIQTYVESKNFPLPDRADVEDTDLTEKVSRDEFQARKKRRIEERKEAKKNAPLAAPKGKPTSSTPTCHEVQGYMPGRLEFDVELHNDAEEAVQHMAFEPGEGAINPQTGTSEPEYELKMSIMDIYNSRLTARAQRKKIIFEHGLLEYRKNAAQEKKRYKEERELYNRIKPFVQLTNNADFTALTQGLEYEHNLRQAIGQLQDWRHHGIGDLKTGEKYESEKATRLARPQPLGVFDRLPGARPPKPSSTVAETPQAVQQLVAPELPERLKSNMHPASANPAASSNITAKSTAQPSLGSSTIGTKLQANGSATLSALPRSPWIPTPIPGMAPLKLHPNESADLHILTSEEKELCTTVRMTPKAYLAVKDAILKESVKQGGSVKRKAIRELINIEAPRSQRIFEFMVRGGWISRA